jgi:hypothetical protein
MKLRRPITLRVYRAPSGQWEGTLTAADGKEIGRVTGCASPSEVEQAAMSEGFFPDRIDVENT